MRRLFCLGLLSLAACSENKVVSTGLTPLTHGDFDHNTLALTWQPGFCTVGSGCASDQPRQPLIGLHGLWASEPHSLETKNIPVEQWWQQGCALLGQQEATPPVLDNAMQASLSEIVPHTVKPLVPHEWTKHAVCFGYRPAAFFAEATSLRLRFARSPIAQWLAERAGTMIRREDLITFFQTATGALPSRALQLRCETDHERRVVLTQLWFTLRPDQMSHFPAAGAYSQSPQNQDNCPTEFWLKRW